MVMKVIYVINDHYHQQKQQQQQQQKQHAVSKPTYYGVVFNLWISKNMLKPAGFVPRGFRSYRLLLGAKATCNRHCTENETFCLQYPLSLCLTVVEETKQNQAKVSLATTLFYLLNIS